MVKKKKNNRLPFPLAQALDVWHWFCKQVDKRHSIRKAIQAAILVGIAAVTTSLLNDPTLLQQESVWYMAVLIALIRGVYNWVKHHPNTKILLH